MKSISQLLFLNFFNAQCFIYDTFSFLNFGEFWWLIKTISDNGLNLNDLFYLPNILIVLLAVSLNFQANILVSAPKKKNVAYMIHRALEG